MIQNFDWPGARWWKFDFHAHTPASEQDYGKGMNHKPGPKEWLLDYMKAGIDCVAITDHNTGDWVDKLKHAYDALKNENHPEFRELYIFPGVELSVMGNVHILGIFPQETSSAEINSIVDRCGFRAKKGTSHAVTDQSLATVLDEIVNKSKGLAIPAHVDDDRGIFKQLQGNDLRPILKSKHIHVVESTQLEINYPAMYHELKLKWTPVLGSDQHYPTESNENKYPGSHYTWIKMSTPCFEGLSLALMDGNLSVIRSIECKKDPNQFAKERIESICIENAKYMGRTKQFEFRLNPWLNTIIGGRGTGKSTLIEFIRLLFRREQELPESLKDLFEKYFQIDENQNDEGLLTQNSILSAIYKKDNYQYKIEWRADGVQPSIYEKSSSGQWIPSQGDICQRFPICIYSQKQIFEMARYPESLMNIVDASLTSICFKDWDQLRNQMEGQYISLMSKVRELSNKIKQIPIIQGELDDISRKLEIFEQSQYSDLLKQYQSAKRQEQAIEDWENSWAEAGQILMRASEDIIPDDIEMHLFNAEDDVLIEFDSKAAHIKDISNQIQLLANKLIDHYKQWSDVKKELNTTKEINNAKSNFEKLQNTLLEEGMSDPKEYGKLLQQKKSIQTRQDEAEQSKDTLKDLEKQANDCLTNLQEHRKKLSESRAQFLSSVLENNAYISIRLVPYANESLVEKQLRSIIHKEYSFDKDIENLLLILFPKTDQESDTITTQIMEDRISTLKQTLQDYCSGEKRPMDSRFADHLKNLQPESFDRLMCWFPEDKLEVKYGSKPIEKFHFSKKASPGQKTAGLLSFLLSYGTEPIALI